MSLLKTTDLGISFGGLRAVDNVNIEIKEGELIGLIGPNGAGKTTIFNLLTGVYKPTDGDITINGTSINKKTTPQIVASGIARTFQNIRLFKNLTVLENVKLALDSSMKYNTFEAILRLPRFWREEKEVTDKALDLLDIFDMAQMANITSGNLSYGQQRKLEIARALATNPKLLLLDEPAAGMNPNETKELMKTISFIRDKFKIAILLPNLKNFIKSILQPAFAEAETATTFVAEPIIVILPPKHEPKDKAHQNTFVSATVWKSGITVLIIFEKVAALATFPIIEVKAADIHIVDKTAPPKCPSVIVIILSPINLMISRFSIPLIIINKPIKKNRVSHSTPSNISLGLFFARSDRKAGHRRWIAACFAFHVEENPWWWRANYTDNTSSDRCISAYYGFLDSVYC